MLKKLEVFDGKISIITAVYNAEDYIHPLIESLRQQADSNFEWVVVDGLSTDNTLKILKKIDDLNIIIISEADFGIYDAFNKGVKHSQGEYYLVAGADDIFYPNAVADYKNAINSNIDIITATVKMGNELAKPMGHSWSWLFGMRAFISCHSVGALIRKELHQKYGFYSRKFPITADQLFIKHCCQSGAQVKVIDKLVGNYGVDGVSARDMFGGCTEMFRVQLLTKENKWVQYLILVIKLTLRMFR